MARNGQGAVDGTPLKGRSAGRAETLLTLALAVGSAPACASRVGATSVATVTPTRAAEASDVERYVLGAGELKVEADVSAGKSVTISFPSKGTLAVSESVTESSEVEIEIDMSNATSAWDSATDIAKSRFLHTDRFPLSTFSSVSMKRTHSGVDVWADFTLHGTKKRLVIPAIIVLDACRARFACELSLDRGEYGIVDDGSLDSIVSDEVVVRVAIDVPRRNAPATCSAKKAASPSGATSAHSG